MLADQKFTKPGATLSETIYVIYVVVLGANTTKAQSYTDGSCLWSLQIPVNSR